MHEKCRLTRLKMWIQARWNALLRHFSKRQKELEIQRISWEPMTLEIDGNWYDFWEEVYRQIYTSTGLSKEQIYGAKDDKKEA